MTPTIGTSQLSNDEVWALVVENDGLVRKATNDFTAKHPSLQFEEYLSAAQIGAYKAIKSFVPDKGAKLSTWMYVCMRNELQTAQRHEADVVRTTDNRYVTITTLISSREGPPNISGAQENETQLEEGNQSFWENLPDPGAEFEDRVVDEIDDEQMLARVILAMGELDVVDRMVIELHTIEGNSFREIGEKLDFSDARAHQRFHRGVAKLREELAA